MKYADCMQAVTLVAGPGAPPSGEGDLESMLTGALDGIIELCGAARGMIALCGPGGEQLFRKARSSDRRDVSMSNPEVSRAIVDRVREQGILHRENDVLAHPVIMGLRSARGLKPLAMGCLPAGEDRRTCGLIYLDRGPAGIAFRRETSQLVEWLAQLISVALTTRELGSRWRWRFLDATKRYSG